VPAIRGVQSQGRTREEALATTILALEGVLESFSRRNIPYLQDSHNQEQTRADFALPDTTMEMVQVQIQVVVTSLLMNEVNSLATTSQ
jgi:predicted RNase H-like HicB family nuclease